MNGNPTPSILERRIWRPFFLNLTLVVMLFAVGLLVGLLFRSHEAADAQVLSRGRSHFATIVMTRRWNAEHGGVYVEKRPGVVSNQYLKNSDIETVDGKFYTKKNPALMTREISEIASRSEDLRFHITSLKPLNPANAPDEFEKEALRRFDHGTTEFTAKVVVGDKTFYRYMAPLITEKSCLACHADQGYKEGDVRGGISISYDITELESSNRASMAIAGLVVIVLTGAVLALIYLFVIRLMRELRDAHARISELATTDGLTGVMNRRTLFENFEAEFERARRHHRDLCVLMLDLDHFKRINDEHGHAAGDEVLKAVGKLLSTERRTNDLVGRYGGEEFSVILPETDAGGAFSKAELLRRLVEKLKVELPNGLIMGVTTSVGVAHMSRDITERPEQMLARADKALYLAKAKGRNVVMLAE